MNREAYLTALNNTLDVLTTKVQLQHLDDVKITLHPETVKSPSKNLYAKPAPHAAIIGKATAKLSISTRTN